MLAHKLEKFLIKSKKVIRNERLALGLTQKEFAGFCGLKYATYKQFEQNGKISFQNFLMIIIGLNKDIAFNQFLDGFEFNTEKQRVKNSNFKDEYNIITPIVPASQKQITLDKNIFGNDLFYSVENGHIYEVSTFISILLKHYNDKRLMLLLKYFGEDRLKPYILKQKNLDLLRKFNKHLEYIQKRKG